ncbi:MAG: preprotein translocase subunit YajC [Pseudomonadota bacterium]
MLAGAPPPSAGWEQFIFLGVFVLIFYFLLIRPQNKRRKEHQALMAGLEKGDEVVTAGGIVGEVTKVEEDFVQLKVGEGVKLRFQKSAVGATLPKGTLKSLEA